MVNIVILDAKTIGERDLAGIQCMGNIKMYSNTSPCDVIDRSKDADIILTNKVVINKDIIDNLPNLKMICVMATGTNNIDVEYAKKMNVVVKNVENYSTMSVAQHTFMFALSLIGKQSYYDYFSKSGGWSKSDIFTHINNEFEPSSLADKNWGIIGLGKIGYRVANLAKAFNMNVSYYSTSGKNNTSEFVREKHLGDLIRKSDVISIHAPLNSQTNNLITKTQLKELKDGAILINMGRGGIVNEDDVAEILKERDIYFACDVLCIEPMLENHPLLNKEIQHKVLITPHIAWAYKESKMKLIDGIQKNIKEFLEGNA